MNVSKIRTISSVRNISDSLYYMESNYDCDRYLEANLSTTEELINWIEKDLFYGIEQSFYEENFGSSTFAAVDENGHRLFGRNFDYDDTDTLVIYNEPKNGYASIGVADLKYALIKIMTEYSGLIAKDLKRNKIHIAIIEIKFSVMAIVFCPLHDTSSFS